MTSAVLTSLRVRMARIDIATAALAMLLIATSVMRLMIGANKPLWLDEIWTGVIVMQPSIEGVVRRCLIDVNAPLYSLLAALWAKASGLSNHALHALPLAFGLLAPLVALASRRTFDQTTRYTWCALLACWLPGIAYSELARPYALALLLAVANTIAFTAVMKSPTHKAAWAWSVISTLLILTHYYGFLLVGFQGLAYLWVHRARAARTWPAALPFAAAFGTIALQAHQIAAFATPGTSWISPPNLVDDAAFIFSGNVITLALAAPWLLAALVIMLRTRRSADRDGAAIEAALWWAPACAAAAVVASIGLGFLRPMFVQRYLLEFVPGMLLGLAMIATALTRKWQGGAVTLVAIFAGSAGLWGSLAPRMPDGVFSWEAASNDLMAVHPSHLAFTWDSPLRPDRTSQADLGGFYFARAGRPIPVDGVQLAKGDDPNPLLLRSAAAPGSAIIWIYDLDVRGTSALRFPPRIEQLDPRWGCRQLGVGAQHVLACSRAWARAAK